VIQFQRAIHPLPDMMHQLKRGFEKYDVETELRHSLRDVEDHVERVISRADSFRDLLQNALTLDGTLTANRQNEASAEQNEQVKKISSWAAIFFAPSFVAGVYGMNFDHMPELHWDLGYPAGDRFDGAPRPRPCMQSSRRRAGCRRCAWKELLWS
jgi:magnesium transporter